MIEQRMIQAGLALLLGATVICAAASDFEPLFNGRDLNGWKIDTPGIWSVRDGMIVGKHEGLNYNDFLRTTKSYKDFVLKVKFRLVDGKGNSGIQIRSKAVPDSHEVAGYQADIAELFWGGLYDESRRNRFLGQAPAKSLEAFDKAGWNEYVITARGDHITLDLNGKRTADYVESDRGIEDSGFIALQVHGSKAPMEVHFKDIQIKVLK